MTSRCRGYSLGSRTRCLPDRANRRQEQLALASAEGKLTEDDASAAERRLNSVAPKRWSKVPDSPLGQVVCKKIAKRLVENR
jgi:hypothetical protein